MTFGNYHPKVEKNNLNLAGLRAQLIFRSVFREETLGGPNLKFIYQKSFLFKTGPKSRDKKTPPFFLLVHGVLIWMMTKAAENFLLLFVKFPPPPPFSRILFFCRPRFTRCIRAIKSYESVRSALEDMVCVYRERNLKRRQGTIVHPIGPRFWKPMRNRCIYQDWKPPTSANVQLSLIVCTCSRISSSYDWFTCVCGFCACVLSVHAQQMANPNNSPTNPITI